MTCTKKDSLTFEYSEDDLLLETSLKCDQTSNSESLFDQELQKKWTHSMDSGYFRYRLNITDDKVLPGKFSFVAQLNPDRAKNRRIPQEMTSLAQPFDPENFNFTKAKDTEIIFKIVERRGEDSDSNTSRVDDDFLFINVSPLEFCNSLLVPSLHACLPQVVTAESLRLAIDVVLLSHTPAMRVGFNSLCGYASVNHLHFHIYYLKHRMLLEHIKVSHLAGPCFELLDYPAKGFVFQLSRNQDRNELARSVHKLTCYLHATNTAHNVFLTRGSRLDDRSEDNRDAYDTVRVYVWARKSSTGAKESAGFNPAMCELFGHLNVKHADFYAGVTEGEVAQVLTEVCWESFQLRREAVAEMFRCS